MADHILAIEASSVELRLTLSKDGYPTVVHHTALPEARELLRASRALFDISEGATPPTPVHLLSFGNDLAQRLLGPLRSTLAGLFGRLWLVCPDSTWLDFPLELIPRRDGSFLIEGGRLSLRRAAHAPWPAYLEEIPRPKPAPLRVVFLAGAFANEGVASPEKEQAFLDELPSGTGAPLQITCAESGTLQELTELVARLQPHVVHLTGQLSIEHSTPRFSFRNASSPAVQDIPSLAATAFTGRGIGLVIVSGHETTPGAIGLASQALTVQGATPLALGSPLPVGDYLATPFMESLYSHLAGGLGVDASLDHARTELLADCLTQDWNGQKILYPDFAQPRLYATHSVDTLLGSARTSPNAQPNSRRAHLSPGQ